MKAYFLGYVKSIGRSGEGCCVEAVVHLSCSHGVGMFEKGGLRSYYHARRNKKESYRSKSLRDEAKLGRSFKVP